MAKFYGTDSAFIKGKQSSRRNWLLLLTGALLVASILMFFVYRHLWYVSPLGFLLAFALTKDFIPEIVKDAGYSFRRLFRLKGNSDRGMLGERIIKQKLEALPDTYSIFRNFHPGIGADYDFIVVGPNGLFAIEVKSQTGKMDFGPRGKGRRLLSQTKRETFDLRKYFLEGWKINTYVHGILVFARSGIKLPEIPQPFEHMYILRADEIATYISEFRGTNPNKEAIEERLGFFYQKMKF